MNCTYLCNNDAEMPTLKIQNMGDCQFTILILQKVVLSRAPPIQPQKYIKYQNLTPKKAKNPPKYVWKMYILSVSFVLSERLTNPYRRMATRFSLYSVCSWKIWGT